MTIVVLPQAADEFDDATANYQDLQADLGRRFRDEVDRHIYWIAEHAEAGLFRHLPEAGLISRLRLAHALTLTGPVPPGAP